MHSPGAYMPLVSTVHTARRPTGPPPFEFQDSTTDQNFYEARSPTLGWKFRSDPRYGLQTGSTDVLWNRLHLGLDEGFSIEHSPHSPHEIGQGEASFEDAPLTLNYLQDGLLTAETVTSTSKPVLLSGDKRDPDVRGGGISYLLGGLGHIELPPKADVQIANSLYDIACVSRHMLTLQLGMEEANPDLIILPHVIDQHHAGLQNLQFLLQCDGIPSAEQEAISAEIIFGQRMCQEATESLEVAQQKVADIRARCDQAELDLADFARLHGLEHLHSNVLSPSYKDLPLSLGGFPGLMPLALPTDPKVLKLGPCGSWYGARYDSLSSPSSSRLVPPSGRSNSNLPPHVAFKEVHAGLSRATPDSHALTGSTKGKVEDAEHKCIENAIPNSSASLDKGKAKEVYPESD
ncbi:hypothetical protein FIBSPDRAFT_1040009 [Athelia psychrophila]|uniref:Uncharacterized protein n=1 Tax=Athelia psychrophila TaxID=1759441 RepID=A0A166QYI8_9AGAM|nr:hypothetical protein FIBSPDRAFT_1040009 [Fibularhizoctonia sp. CBS 109695]